MDAISLYPVDVWSVRDARPFDVGGTVLARSVWPPSPWTILGALRTLLCEVSGIAAVDYGVIGGQDPSVVALSRTLGPADGPPSFALGPTLVGNSAGEFCWPRPADVVTYTARCGEAETVRLARLRLVEVPRLERIGYAASLAPGRELVLLPPRESERADKEPALRDFSTAQLAAWLAGGPIPQLSRERGGEDPGPVGSEPRIGIQIDPDTGTVRQGMFYLRYAHALRHGWKIVVPVMQRGPAGVPWERVDGQLVRLGADGHLAAVRWATSAPPWPQAHAAAHGRAALVFLSPVRPDDLDSISVGGERVRVVAVVAGRPVSIGGWRLRADGQFGRQVGPRELRRYYPPGTVAYVRAEGANVSGLHATSVARDPEERAAGFGFCLVGRWPSEEE